jgi:hypothetical protein
LFLCVPPSSSKSISLKMFQIWFYPMWFTQSSAPMYINWKGCQYGAQLFLFGNLGSKEGLLFVECPIFQSIGDGPTDMAPCKKKKKSVNAPRNSLIWIISFPTHDLTMASWVNSRNFFPNFYTKNYEFSHKKITRIYWIIYTRKKSKILLTFLVKTVTNLSPKKFNGPWW